MGWLFKHASVTFEQDIEHVQVFKHYITCVREHLWLVQMHVSMPLLTLHKSGSAAGKHLRPATSDWLSENNQRPCYCSWTYICVGRILFLGRVGRVLDGNRPTRPVHVTQVEALLDRVKGQPPAVAWLGEQFEHLGYCSWAYRVVNTASAAPSMGSLDMC